MEKKITSHIAWELLAEGNERFVAGRSQHSHRDRAQRLNTSDSQQPYAVVLCCSDSRVVPELIFDCGIGDLFVVRIAGNIVTPEVLGTVEFAVAALSNSLVVVMGPRNCVAVGKAIAHSTEYSSFHSIIVRIGEGIGDCRDVPQAIEKNAYASVHNLMQSPLLSEQIAQNLLQVQAAIYDNISGNVRLLPFQ